MKIVNIQTAKTQQSRLVEVAAAGEPFIIAKAGKPMMQVTRLEEAPKKPRSGFMPGIRVPDDFDTIMADEIAEMFYGQWMRMSSETARRYPSAGLGGERRRSPVG